MITYSGAIRACEKGARSHEALGILLGMPSVARDIGLFRDMRLHRLEPNVIIDDAAISACEKSSRRHEASGMLSEMRLPLGGDSDHLLCRH